MSRHFYRDHVYPFLVKWLGNPEPIRKIRERLIPFAHGTVLEVGAGSGANFPYYRPERVSKLYALEPNPGMIQLAKEQQQGLAIDVEYINLPGERIPLVDGTVNTAVSTFTLCTIDAVQDAIREIRRVLEPGGQLIFIELGRSPDSSVLHWQKLFEPAVHWMYAGLHITRDIPHLITEGGFKMEQMDKGYLAAFPRALTYCYWGTSFASSFE
jgi:ubiquinone/menaquinone biosynthesis C-methylase UbiE